MEGFTVLDWAGHLSLAVVASLVVLWIIGKVLPGQQGSRTLHPAIAETENAFLFQDGVLADHDCTQTDVLDQIEDWPGLRAWLGPRFGDLPHQLHQDVSADLVFPSVAGSKDPARLRISTTTDTVRVTLKDQVPAQPADRHQAMRLQRALNEDHAALQEAPYAIWKTDDSGRMIWQNTACNSILGAQIDKVLEMTEPPCEPGTTNTSRISVAQPGTDALSWFDIQTTVTDKFHLHYATDITRAVQAEAAQREFVQTLTKTFANLTTGLAIFDRNKQLALFNPALVDLTCLPAEFLSGRPSLMSFFDKLRDRQVMPEPKSYSEWRAQITQMIEAASDGLYQDTWSLPTGVTYRVTGRPHPDGAVAFLFEDISAEISLTRRFRAQNDLRQSVLDKLDHAIAIIAPNNVVTFCNAACTNMFGVDPDTSFADLLVRDLLLICDKKFPDPELWKAAETQITCKTLVDPIEQTITLDDGKTLHCRVLPLSGGAAIICQILHPAINAPVAEPLAS